ncbi:MAG TPA: hypothetical protein VHC22_05735 [Pirellulales bacterium]|nr:hypothetical protein [Pirellulales bacterium]
MQLDFAFLSQMADFLTDDKLVAWGIGIAGLEASTMPFQASPMALVARLLLLPEERDHGHTYAVKVIYPNGEETFLCQDEPLNTRHRSPGQPSGANLLVSLTIFYSSAGVYRFQLLLDGHTVKDIPLEVFHVPGPAGHTSLTEASQDADGTRPSTIRT